MVLVLSVLILWVISLCLHEYAHARVAFAGGDDSVVEKGYLTMNPVRYLHPCMSVGIPVLILLWGGVPLPGGAVYIDHSRLRSRDWEAAVAAAGPATNLLILLLCGAVFRLGLLDPSNLSDSLTLTIALFAFFQAFATILNLLPVPGLDGFGIIAPYLPPQVRRSAMEFSTIAFVLLLMLLITDNPVKPHIWGIIISMVELSGIPWITVKEGLNVFKETIRG